MVLEMTNSHVQEERLMEAEIFSHANEGEATVKDWLPA